MSTFLDFHAACHSKNGDYAVITAERKRDISILMLAVADVADRIATFETGYELAPGHKPTPEEYKDAFFAAMQRDRKEELLKFMAEKADKNEDLSMTDDRKYFDMLIELVAQDMVARILGTWSEEAKLVLQSLSMETFIRQMTRK